MADKVHFSDLDFTLSTTAPDGKVVNTIIHLTADDVPLEHVVGAMTAGASRRTVWQNDKKATRKKAAKTIPTEDTIKWGDWIGTNRAATVIVHEARKLTPEEVFAQAMADPSFMERYKAHQDALAQAALDAESKDE